MLVLVVGAFGGCIPAGADPSISTESPRATDASPVRTGPSPASPGPGATGPSPTAAIAVTFMPVYPTDTCILVDTAPSAPDARFGARGHLIMLRGLSGQPPRGVAGIGTTFHLPAPEGDWEMTVQVGEGYAPAVTRFSLAPGTCAEFQVVLQAVADWRLPPATPDPGWAFLEGRVTDDNGEPLPGHEVGAALTPSYVLGGSTYTDADGRYRLHLRPGEYSVGVVPHRGHRLPKSAIVQVMEGEVAVQDFTLERR